MTAPDITVNLSATLSGTAGPIAIGDVVVPSPLGYVKATDVNRTAGGRAHGVSLSAWASTTPGSVRVQNVGVVDAAITGLGAGAASWVRVSTAGRLERAAVATTDDVVGWCHTDGTLFATFGVLTAAIVNSSSGGTPGGSTKAVQYNNGGVFAGSAVVTIDEVAQELDVTTAAQATLIRMRNYAGASTNGANFVSEKARGTILAPTKALNGDQLGGFSARGWYEDSTPAFGPSTASSARFFAEEDFTSTTNGTAYVLSLCRAGSTSVGERFRVAGSGFVTITTSPVTSGSNGILKAIGTNHTNQTAGTELNDVLIDGTATLQFATGSIASQSQVLIKPRTYSAVAASTISKAATLAIAGAPIAGTNATLTNKYALWVKAGLAQFDGTISAPGVNTEVLFNDAGVINGDASMVYTKASGTLEVGNLQADGTVNAVVGITTTNDMLLSSSGGLRCSISAAKATFTTRVECTGLRTTGETSSAATGTQNNFSLGGNRRVRFTNANAPTLTGIDATGIGDGDIIELISLASVTNVIISHEDAGSTAANRFSNIAAVASLSLWQNGITRFQYDGTSQRWRWCAGYWQ